MASKSRTGRQAGAKRTKWPSSTSLWPAPLPRSSPPRPSTSPPLRRMMSMGPQRGRLGVDMTSRPNNREGWPRNSSTGPGGGLSSGPGGGMSTGPGGGASTGPGGGMSTGPGGGASTGPGGGLSTGPGGGMSTGPGGGLSTSPGGGLSTSPSSNPYHSNIPPRGVFLEQLLLRGYVAQYRKLKAAWRA